MSRNPEIIIVAGAQWGDEGKGKIVDLLAEEADVVFKANGGRNAGHSVKNEHGSFALHLTPAGIFYPGKDNVVGNNVVYSLRAGMEEIRDLEARGVPTDRLFISSRAHLVLDYHEREDILLEKLRGEGKIGTTATGNGPAYSDKANRIGIRSDMLEDPSEFMDELNRILKLKSDLYFSNKPTPPEFQAEFYEGLIKEASEFLGPRVIDLYQYNDEQLRKGARILIEGSHGALLDIDGGTYPMVTSSSCNIYGLLSGAGLPSVHVDRAIGVFKPYQTRVGAGPMPTELLDDNSERIREQAHEYGTTTGRPRRVGWFDGTAARQSQLMNGFREIVIPLGDALTGINVKVSTGYLLDGKVINNFPSRMSRLASCQPVLSTEEFYWTENFRGATSWEDLPQGAQRLYRKIANLVDSRVTYIGTGPSRDENIKLDFDIREMY